MIPDDVTLVERVLAGDTSAFGSLIDRHWPKALSLALRSLGNFADAEDTVQDAFLQALLSLPTLRQMSRFDSWLFGIVLNLCRMRKRARRSEINFDEWVENQNGFLVVPEWAGGKLQLSTEEICATHEAHRALLTAVDSLPARQQQAVRLHYLDGAPLAEMALLTGAPLGAVKVRLHRARARLRTALAGKAVDTQIRNPLGAEEILMSNVIARETVAGDEGAGLRLPLIPLRDMVVFPHMVAPLFIGRQKSLQAFREAVTTHKTVFLTTQRDATVNDPIEEDIHEVGTIAAVTQLLHLADGTMKVAVEGKRRGRIQCFLDHADFLLAKVEEIEEKQGPTDEVTLLMSNVTAAFIQADLTLKKTPLSSDMVQAMTAIGDSSRLADTIIP